jgi:uncharacterized membrane protein SpoIIM required for sporulation
MTASAAPTTKTAMTTPATTTAAPAPGAAGTSARHVTLLTAERVPLTLPVAGLGERAMATLVDALLLLGAALALLFLYTFQGRGDLERDIAEATRATAVLAALLLAAVVVGYDVAFDRLGGGRTPGKRLLRLRVVDGHGLPPDLVTSALRNLLRLLDMLPLGYGVGLVALFLTGTRRVGDLVAGTVVISERARAASVVDALSHAAGGRVSSPAWNDDHVLRAVDVVARTEGLAAGPADALCARVAAALPPVGGDGGARARLAAGVVALADDGAGVAARLFRLHGDERRLRRALARHEGRRVAGGDEGDHHGDDDRNDDAGAQLDACARAAAATLLAAARRGVPARALESLSLALLEVERRRRPPPPPTVRRLRRFLREDVPAAVWAERHHVARVAAVLAASALFGFAVARVDAEVARALVGDDLADAIEAGARWTDRIAEDDAYASTSLAVIVNNVGVGLRVFALGVFGGVATLLGVMHNGLTLGAVFGYATMLGTQATLARFLVAHGPVELSMICVAGAAGLCLGRAVLAPGRRTRLQALRHEGARGVRLLAFATIGFVVIGTVEGFVSPGQHFPLLLNVAVGLSLWLLFLGWAATGRHNAPLDDAG